LFLAPALGFTSSARADHAEEAGIIAAVSDYVSSAYDVAPERLDRSVHAKLQKVGYYRSGPDEAYSEHFMNFDQLRELVAGWNKDGHFDPATARRDIRVLDHLDVTAVARLDAEWGIDYFQLAKIDDKWMIVNVIWQTYPASKDEKTR
jgi:hypothetical protein